MDEFESLHQGESRWALEESKLCDTPTDVALRRLRGRLTLVDQLLAGMRKQAKAWIDGKLTTCRAVTEVTPSSMVLKTLDSAIETSVKGEDTVTRIAVTHLYF